MGLRLLALLAVTGIACSAAAVAAGAHSKRVVAAVPRIPALPAKNPVHHGARCPIPPRFRTAFVDAARDTGFQLSMLVAVAQVESRFKPNARSEADARGLLQVLPSTAASLKLNVDNPVTNVLAGARYLKLLLDRYSRTDLALAAYNAGPTAVDRAGGAPTGETVSYVANVQQRWALLAGCS
ncbi:MAG TPA: lytic transglycosylase domain-containing protein [Gaiellaceae bacterium]